MKKLIIDCTVPMEGLVKGFDGIVDYVLEEFKEQLIVNSDLIMANFDGSEAIKMGLVMRGCNHAGFEITSGYPVTLKPDDTLLLEENNTVEQIWYECKKCHSRYKKVKGTIPFHCGNRVHSKLCSGIVIPMMVANKVVPVVVPVTDEPIITAVQNNDSKENYDKENQ